MTKKSRFILGCTMIRKRKVKLSISIFLLRKIIMTLIIGWLRRRTLNWL